MTDKFYFVELFECYKKLLTDKQREIFGMHFAMDFSLSEIAEELGITRQNVSDTLKTVKEKLADFENALHLNEKNKMLIGLAAKSDKATADKIEELINR